MTQPLVDWSSIVGKAEANAGDSEVVNVHGEDFIARKIQVVGTDANENHGEISALPEPQNISY